MHSVNSLTAIHTFVDDLQFRESCLCCFKQYGFANLLTITGWWFLLPSALEHKTVTLSLYSFLPWHFCLFNARVLLSCMSQGAALSRFKMSFGVHYVMIGGCQLFLPLVCWISFYWSTFSIHWLPCSVHLSSNCCCQSLEHLKSVVILRANSSILVEVIPLYLNIWIQTYSYTV